MTISLTDPSTSLWAAVPFQFWSVVFFILGCIVGSFLNVCIHRLPLDESIVSPPSHCPHCKYSIPWYLNIPLVTWLYLGGKCKNCGARISIRYFLVELLTGAGFLGCWVAFGHQSTALTLIYCMVLGGLIVATAIDVEHLIIPDGITFGGAIAGVVCSVLLPRLQGENTMLAGLGHSLLGLVVGGGVIYAIVRGGKLAFGRQRVTLPAETKIVFGETAVHLPDKDVPFEELFYRKSDVIVLEAKTVELADRCYRDVRVRLGPEKLEIGEDEFSSEEIPHLEVVCSEIVLPREAMGLGDAKLMAAIGAFLGWQGVLFTLTVSTLVGSIYGIAMILLRKQMWSGRLYFGPFLALAAAVWIFDGPALVNSYQQLMQRLLGR